MRATLAGLLLLPTAGLFTAGCGGDDDSSTPSEVATSDPAATTPVATVDIDPASGLPRSFPDDFPILEDATVSRASEYSDRYVIEWRSADSYDDAMGFYEGALAADPWTTESTSTDEAATVFEFSGGTGSGYTGTLAVAALAEGSRILLELHPPEAR